VKSCSFFIVVVVVSVFFFFFLFRMQNAQNFVSSLPLESCPSHPFIFSRSRREKERERERKIGGRERVFLPFFFYNPTRKLLFSLLFSIYFSSSKTRPSTTTLILFVTKALTSSSANFIVQ
jgi:hypothetical protein